MATTAEPHNLAEGGGGSRSGGGGEAKRSRGAKVWQKKDEEDFLFFAGEFLRAIREQRPTSGEEEEKGEEEEEGGTRVALRESANGSNGSKNTKKTPSEEVLELGEGGGSGQAAPKIEPDGGSFEGSVRVTFVTNHADAVFFTTDGSDPCPILSAQGVMERQDFSEAAVASGGGQFTATVLCSCVVKAVCVQHAKDGGGGHAGGGRRASESVSAVSTSLRFELRCATPMLLTKPLTKLYAAN